MTHIMDDEDDYKTTHIYNVHANDELQMQHALTPMRCQLVNPKATIGRSIVRIPMHKAVEQWRSYWGFGRKRTCADLARLNLWRGKARRSTKFLYLAVYRRELKPI